jgi:REP element-mobilizing transposase RayT
MGRPLRVDVGGYVYHMLNRASARATLFENDDYHGFEQVLAEAQVRTGMRLLAYCLMPNHWHLVLWPEADGTLSRFMTWLTLTHTQRWHARRRSAEKRCQEPFCAKKGAKKGVRNLFGRGFTSLPIRPRLDPAPSRPPEAGSEKGS